MERPSPKQVTIFNREALEEATKAQVAWADRVFRRRLIVSTSFGIQSAVILHLVSRMLPACRSCSSTPAISCPRPIATRRS